MRATVFPGPETVRYGGQTSCISLELSDGSLVILDAGTGIRSFGMSLGDRHPRRVDVLISHLHTDHIEGSASSSRSGIHRWTSTSGAPRHRCERCSSAWPRSSRRRSSRCTCATCRRGPSHPRGDADLLLHDGQYTPEEYDGRIGWGHPTPEAAVTFAVRAGARRLVLFHHDPMHTDDQLEAMLADAEPLASQGSITVELAGEGAIYEP